MFLRLFIKFYEIQETSAEWRQLSQPDINMHFISKYWDPNNLLYEQQMHAQVWETRISKISLITSKALSWGLQIYCTFGMRKGFFEAYSHSFPILRSFGPSAYQKIKSSTYMINKVEGKNFYNKRQINAKAANAIHDIVREWLKWVNYRLMTNVCLAKPYLMI